MSLAEITLPRAGTLSVGSPRTRGRALAAFVALTGLLSGGIVVALVTATTAWTPLSALAVVLAALSAIWIAGGAATAMVGLVRPGPAPQDDIAADWQPAGRTAVLLLICGEDPAPVAAHLAALRPGLDRLGLGASTRIFVLSDTSGPRRIAAEDAAFAPLVADGTITLRRRSRNTGRKPGNIAEWLSAEGSRHDYMLVLDADSRMSAGRVRRLIHRIETHPRTGLVQAGMTLVPGRSRFGRHQRVSSRLLSPNFGRGLAAWAGEAGNYWGHNAIMRIAAFRAAAPLPCLSGPPPFGGPPLSHDFVEAAWIRRAGWAVELDPDTRGSAEDGPQTLADFHRRDRRWCQGNLQHLRLLGEPGLDPVSRLHLASGILGYLAAPIWLFLVVLIASGAIEVGGALPFLLVAAVLLLPKLCAVADWMRRARTGARRRVILRASVAELALSTIIAPLVMVRQTGAVVSVFMGRDCGWKSGRKRRVALPSGLAEAVVGVSALALAALVGPEATAPWLLPVALPLIAAPGLYRILDRGA
jgi:membrane glycosyltransferase